MDMELEKKSQMLKGFLQRLQLTWFESDAQRLGYKQQRKNNYEKIFHYLISFDVDSRLD